MMSLRTLGFWMGLLFLLPSMACTSTPESVNRPVVADSLAYKIGQMLMVGFRGMTLEDDNPIIADITQRHLGGVIVFDYDVPTKKAVRNIKSPAQLKNLIAQLQAQAGTPLLVAIDQEGGRVNRLKEKYGFSASVSAQALGTKNDLTATRAAAQTTAQTLADLGINLNFAPVVDVNTNPQNPVIGKIERSFSENPEVVYQHAAEVTAAHREAGVWTALKHFPGHGSSMDDSHLGLTDVTQTWAPLELIPYAKLIEAGQVDMIMTAHIVNRNLEPSGLPATLSAAIMQGVLRDSLGFEGVIVSDDMQMGAITEHFGLEPAIRQALEAGVDLLTFANNSVFEPDIAERAIAIIKKLVADGVITEDRIDASYRRLAKLKAQLH